MLHYPVDYTNSTRVAASNDRLVTVNNAVEVDLYGQVCAESSGTRHITARAVSWISFWPGMNPGEENPLYAFPQLIPPVKGNEIEDTAHTDAGSHSDRLPDRSTLYRHEYGCSTSRAKPIGSGPKT
jgi:hypothetical protein